MIVLDQLKNPHGLMVDVLTSNAVDRGFEPRLGQTKDYIIGICCYSAICCSGIVQWNVSTPNIFDTSYYFLDENVVILNMLNKEVQIMQVT
jgi:hypothetical protein